MPESDRPRIRVALHVHTLYSACSETRLEEIPDYLREQGIDVLGVTDHDTIAGALALKAMFPELRLVVGEEIRTRNGEITGLFLKEEIEHGLSPVETCERIKAQSGLVYIPHPFDPFKFHRLRRHALYEVLPMVDIIEVFNGKANLPIFNSFAAAFARKHGKVGAVGSDAHYLYAIGLCTNEMADFQTPQEFLENLRHARLITEHTWPLRTWWVGIKNVLRGEGHKVKHLHEKIRSTKHEARNKSK